MSDCEGNYDDKNDDDKDENDDSYHYSHWSKSSTSMPCSPDFIHPLHISILTEFSEMFIIWAPIQYKDVILPV